ncbi:DUF4037 domain-containing protein [Paenibacillus eucommiae]|uniref:DUF4037 domain-containing protein n=1 Tax=Paenibacillus eucommiae TaxID=1355755 RepID=A0ABS4J413_9BACL|nr:DUF4037 domain-containing protein [Paenibacillus eucommiae]MBP1994582.1 hypothetical protein [Paenibacillus eucommiae]
MQGIALCRQFFVEIIEPLMANFSSITYSAALIGPGSEVLGYDTEMSRDHDWSPRVQLFLNETDIRFSENIRALLDGRVPQSFCGFPIDTSMTIITTVPRFIESCLAFDINGAIEPVDWLTFPSQTLLEITSGEVYRDDTGELLKLRQSLAYYPHDIWLYLMASSWQRIGQEEHLMLRAGFVGDELGSAVIASRIVRDVMNLCFLLECQYAPYPKWFGTTFRTLKCSELVMSHLWTVQTAATWREREQALNKVYTHLASLHNRLGITEKISEEASYFYNRPFKVMNGEGIAGLIASEIKDTEIFQLSKKRLIGSIDQITDNTDFRLLNKWKDGDGKLARNALKQIYLG